MKSIRIRLVTKIQRLGSSANGER